MDKGEFVAFIVGILRERTRNVKVVSTLAEVPLALAEATCSCPVVWIQWC